MGFFGSHELPDALLIGQRPRIMDAFAGYEGVCRLEDFDLPFGSLLEREELYRLRDESGLTGQEFYVRYFVPAEAMGTVLELGVMTLPQSGPSDQ